MQFLHVQNAGIYFVLTTTVNVSPNLGLEMLARVVLVVGDYCGSISEEAIRKNFLMIYELIDEMMVLLSLRLSPAFRLTCQDFGYPQETTTDVLRAYVTNSIQGAQAKRSTTMTSILPYKNTSISASGANRSVAGDNFDKEELFVDLFEYVNVIFDGSVC